MNDHTHCGSIPYVSCVATRPGQVVLEKIPYKCRQSAQRSEFILSHVTGYLVVHARVDLSTDKVYCSLGMGIWIRAGGGGRGGECGAVAGCVSYLVLPWMSRGLSLAREAVAEEVHIT